MNYKMTKTEELIHLACRKTGELFWSGGRAAHQICRHRSVSKEEALAIAEQADLDGFLHPDSIKAIRNLAKNK